MHRAPADLIGGPAGVLRSMIVQLAAHLEKIEELHADTLNTWLNALASPEEPSLHNLCALFHALFQQLPSHTPVYCLISDLDPLSVDGVLASFETLIECLRDLVTANLPAPFKVLMASSTDITDYIREQLETPSLSAFRAQTDRTDVLREMIMIRCKTTRAGAMRLGGWWQPQRRTGT